MQNQWQIKPDINEVLYGNDISRTADVYEF